MAKTGPLIGAMLCGLLALSGTVAAQTSPPWSPIPYPAMGRGSAACTHAGGQGDVFCFGLRCNASDGMPEWFTYQVGGDSADGEVRVDLIVDGRSRSTLLMSQSRTPQGEWSFAAPHDPARDRSMLDRLRAGSGLSVMVGGVSGAHLSLRGSSREIGRAIAMCRAAGAPAEKAPSTAGSASDGTFGEPYDAVAAMMGGQGCEATESEIVKAITEAGFGIWDANLFVADGAEDGTLELVDRTDEVYTYRLAGCATGRNALAVDPGAAGLTLASGQLPPPVRAQLDEIAAACGDAFRTEGRSGNAFLADDLDGDGIYDFLLDHAQFCPSQMPVLCGASRCPFTLFVSGGDEWRRFDFILQGYREFSEKGFLFMCSTDDRKAGVFMESGELTRRDCR